MKSQLFFHLLFSKLIGVMILCTGVAFAQPPWQEPTISVTSQNDLMFHSVIAGQNKTITPQDADAAKFVVSSDQNADVLIALSLPTELSGSFGASLPIVFGSTSGRYHNQDRQTGGTIFDPNQSFQFSLRPPSRECHIWLGGQIQTAFNQPPGNYTATVGIWVEVISN